MTEVNRRVRDLGTYNGTLYDTRPQTLVPFAKDYAATVLEFIDTHYNDFAEFSYSSAIYDDTDSDPTPTIQGVSGGTFSSTTGLTINAMTGEIDISTSTTGNYVVTYEIGTCNYYKTTQNVEIINNTLGLETFSEANFTLYPNPTDKAIHFIANTNISTVKLFTLLGQEIQTVDINAKEATVDLSKFKSGTYVMSFLIENRVVSSKLIVKN